MYFAFNLCFLDWQWCWTWFDMSGGYETFCSVQWLLKPCSRLAEYVVWYLITYMLIFCKKTCFLFSQFAWYFGATYFYNWGCVNIVFLYDGVCVDYLLHPGSWWWILIWLLMDFKMFLCKIFGSECTGNCQEGSLTSVLPLLYHNLLPMEWTCTPYGNWLLGSQFLPI